VLKEGAFDAETAGWIAIAHILLKKYVELLRLRHRLLHWYED